MNELYNTYERFIAAAKKFPRWNNVRRRPTKSVGGALLHSIIEEIGKVEDAIIEYKKDFFIVNYIGKEDSIIDYLYSAQVGSLNIEDVKVNEYKVTNDIKEFYSNEGYAYYQDSYLVFKEPASNIEYEYNGFIYNVKTEKNHIWNIFDEFAWWSGIERFDNELNKSLLIRTINQFHERPNSSEYGLKNVICNVISGDNAISKNDIVFERPDENNLYIVNSDGEILYEEISKFNHDIARTKQWDTDYWSHEFCSAAFLPHKWDAEVKHYKDGVGYNNSLYVSKVKDLDTEQKTDITVSGYKKSTEKIEEYVKNNNITTDIKIELKKYDDTIKPINVQYKIEASTLTEMDFNETGLSKTVYIDSYKTSKREIEYSIDELYLDKESNISIAPRNKLKTNNNYVLKILPLEEDYPTMDITKCQLKHKNGAINLLQEKGSFGYNSRGLFTNKSVLLHADKLGDFNSASNLVDYRYGGLTLSDLSNTASCSLDISSIKTQQPITILTSCDLYEITNDPTYIKQEGFVLKDGAYISGSSAVDQSVLTIELMCKDIEFSLDKVGSSLSSAYINIETYIDGTLDRNHSYYNASPNILKKYSLKQFNLKQVKIAIQKNSATPFKISDIMVNRYEIKAVTSDGVDISPNKKESVTLTKSNSEHRYIDITISNYGNTKPILKCVHIGASLNIINATHTIDIDTHGLTDPEIILESNCRADLYLKSDQNNPIDFSPFNLYTNTKSDFQSIFLDLSSFKEIYYSNPEIKYSNGKPYIQLKPGVSLDTMIVYGDSEKLIGRKTLKDVIGQQNNSKVYANKSIKKIVVKCGDGTEKLELLDYNRCTVVGADTYKVWGRNYKDLMSCFVSNSEKQVEILTDKYSGTFEYLYLFDKNTTTSIAYNQQNIIKNETTDIDIIKNFSPIIKSADKMLFIIDDVRCNKGNFTVSFVDNQSFSTSLTKRIKIVSDDNLIKTDSFDFTLKSLNKKFAISNNIPLSDTYTIDNEEIELGRYILEVPDKMEILYEDRQVTQERDSDNSVMYSEEDGFNKLLHSNIVTIDKVIIDKKVVPPSAYSLIEEAGVIKWENSSYLRKAFNVTYTYKKPKYIIFKDLSYLYDLVGYNIDAFKSIDTVDNEYKIYNLKDGDAITINSDNFIEKPEKYSIRCSNPCYVGVISEDNKTVHIKKIAEDDTVVIHNGYYYIDGKEYYYFADKQELSKDKADGVTPINTKNINNQIVFKQRAENYLRNSKMICNTMNVHCISNFKKYNLVDEANLLEETGLCSTFTNWHSCFMNVKLTEDSNGKPAIAFESKNKNAYAVLDITKALLIDRNTNLACKFAGDLKVSVGREILIDGYQVSKTLYIKSIDDYNGNGYYDCSNLEPDKYRYYIIVTGSGILSEVTVVEKEYPFKHCFNSNLDRLDFNIKEEVEPGTISVLNFVPTGCNLNSTELSKDLTIRIASTADWGITKISDIDLSKVKKSGFLYRYDSLIAEKDGAVITSLPIRTINKESIGRIYVKINKLEINDFKDFDLRILGSNVENGTYTEIYNKTKSNLFTFTPNTLPGYIKLEITADEGKIVTDIEVFVLYKEVENWSLPFTTIDSGSITTKIYDLGNEAKYMLKNVNQLIENNDNIRYQIRALKISNNDNIWTDWYNKEENHVFDGYRYFQIKAYIYGYSTEVKIESFVFEVKD